MSFNLNANIPLLAQVADPLGSAQGGFRFAQEIQQAPLQNQLLQQKVDQRQQALVDNQKAAAATEQDRVITSLASGFQEISGLVDAGDFKGAVDVLTTRRARLLSEGRDTAITDEAIQAYQSGDATLINRATIKGNQLVDAATSRGLLPGAAQNVSAEQRGFERLIEDFTPEEQVQARKTRAGIIAKAGDSSAERIARDEGLAAQVSQVEAQKAESRALGKIKGEAKGAPLVAKAKSDIATAVKLATAEASARGEALSDLKKAEAGLPGLEEVVVKLKDLSSAATFTTTGRVFNAVAKELGFGSTKGATARAAYQATIDNQVLPLLKQTFGAAMTEGEGKRLADTLGDVNAAPAAKVAQLDAFIDSQKRQIENLKRETGEAPAQSSFTSSSGITFTVN